MSDLEGEHHLKDCLFHGFSSKIWNELHYMYDNPNSQYSKLAATETPGCGVSGVRAKSAVLGLETQSKTNSSEPPYEAIMQWIVYLMSAVTNQNASNNAQNGVRCKNGNEKFPNMKTQRPKRDQKGMLCWECGVLDMGGGNA